MHTHVLRQNKKVFLTKQVNGWPGWEVVVRVALVMFIYLLKLPNPFSYTLLAICMSRWWILIFKVCFGFVLLPSQHCCLLLSLHGRPVHCESNHLSLQAAGKAPRRPQAYVSILNISVTLLIALCPDATRIPRKQMIKILTPSRRGPRPGLRGRRPRRPQRIDIPRILRRPAPWDSTWDCVRSTTFKYISCPRMRNTLRCQLWSFGSKL